MGKGLTRGGEQLGAGSPGQLLGYGYGAAQGAAGGLHFSRGHVAGGDFSHRHTVDSRTDAAEYGDTERPTQLGAGLRDGGRRAGPLRRGTANDEVGGQDDDWW